MRRASPHKAARPANPPPSKCRGATYRARGVGWLAFRRRHPNPPPRTACLDWLTKRLGLAALAAALALAACSPADPQEESLPPLPEVEREAWSAAVRGQFEKAWQEAERRPGEAAPAGRLGMLFHAYRDYSSALQCYRRARLLDPGTPRWAYLLGVVQAELGRPEKALQSLRSFLNERPDYAAAWLRLGDLLLAEGRVEDSRRAYQQALEKDASCAAAYYGLGRTWSLEGQDGEASAYYEKACRLNSGFRPARYALALAHRRLGRRDQAERQMEEYRQADPNVRRFFEDPLVEEVEALKLGAHYHNEEGRRLEAAGRIEEAREHYERALQFDPELAPAHVNLISIYGTVGDYAKAKMHYRRSLEINPRLEESHYNFGVVCVMEGRYSAAADAFRKALEVNPSSPEAHNNLAYALEQLGRTDEAFRHYKLAVENKPDYRTAHFHLGRHFYNQGRYQEAIEHFNKTLVIEDERTPQVLYVLALSYAQLGREDKFREMAALAKEKALAFGQKDLAASISRQAASAQPASKALP